MIAKSQPNRIESDQTCLYHRFLLTPKAEMKCLCLQAMTIVYGRHHQEIGPFHDTKYIVAMLDRTLDRVERDRLLLFLDKLILHKDNVSSVVQANGIKILLELLPLAHLHTSRAVMKNTNTTAIEANPDTTAETQVWALKKRFNIFQHFSLLLRAK